MHVTDIRAFQPPTPGSPNDWRTQLGQIVVDVETDCGLKGIGVGGGGTAGIHIVETVLRDLLVGRPIENIPALHRAMCSHTAFYGRKGLVVMAISGVDLALWDLAGKQQGVSVAELLNADVDLSISLPTYSTVFDDEDAEVGPIARDGEDITERADSHILRVRLCRTLTTGPGQKNCCQQKNQRLNESHGFAP